MEIDKQIEILREQIKNLELVKQEIEKSNIYKISTNTAFLLNNRFDEIFSGFGFFPDFLRLKHENHWSHKNSSQVEITFKVMECKEVKK